MAGVGADLTTPKHSSASRRWSLREFAPLHESGRVAQPGRLRRCSDCVRSVRYFCRADEGTGMPLDPLRKSSTGRSLDAVASVSEDCCRNQWRRKNPYWGVVQEH
jgi:hypothetical protein